MGEKDFWIGFSVFPGIGPVTFQSLLERFGNAKNAWFAPEKDLEKILKEKKTKDFLTFREQFDFGVYKKRLEKAEVSIVTLRDEIYPKGLKEIKNPPFVLYVRGDSVILGNEAKYKTVPGEVTPESDSGQARMTIAIVGTRKITQYGRDVTELFTSAISNTGCSIVSGLAMGVDAVAHQTTIDNGGKTIAVLGCGVDCVYPRENQQLYDAIIESGGVIVSEVPIGMSPNRGTFPARNRIIAGLSQAVSVTEGTEDSGALITAEFGIEYGRKVFAVPGPITSSLSKGPYKLIEKGARLVTHPKDVLQELQINNYELRIEKKKKIIGESKEEQMLIDLLANEPFSFDEIVRSTNIHSSKIATLLSLMEIKGIIKTLSNGDFGIAN